MSYYSRTGQYDIHNSPNECWHCWHAFRSLVAQVVVEDTTRYHNVCGDFGLLLYRPQKHPEAVRQHAKCIFNDAPGPTQPVVKCLVFPGRPPSRPVYWFNHIFVAPKCVVTDEKVADWLATDVVW